VTGSLIRARGNRNTRWLGSIIVASPPYTHCRRCQWSQVEPGLYILGLDWLYKRNSGPFNGMSNDAVYLASVSGVRHGRLADGHGAPTRSPGPDMEPEDAGTAHPLGSRTAATT